MPDPDHQRKAHIVSGERELSAPDSSEPHRRLGAVASERRSGKLDPLCAQLGQRLLALSQIARVLGA